MAELKEIIEELTKNLTVEQSEAVVFPPKGNLRISAGAGSGKTEVLTRRIDALLKQGVKASEIVAITYTTKAASEMKTRLSEKRKISSFNLRNMKVATFHSFLSGFLKKDPFGAGVDSSVSVISENTRSILLLDLAERFAEKYGEKIIRGDRSLGAELAAPLVAEFPKALSKIRRYLLSPGEFYRKARHDLEKREPRGTELEFNTLEWLYQFYTIYMEELGRGNLLDFDEILIKSKYLIKEMGENSAIPEERVFLIDEFQDNNPNQLGIIEEFCRGRESQICVVGDEKQSIYKFQGANVETFRDFVSDQDIILKDNFRSYSEIINFSDSFLEKSGDVGKMFVKQFARRGSSPRQPAVSCLLTPDEMEPSEVSNQIAQFIQSIVASKLAIPDRKNAGEMRQVRYGDIAIILNSVKNLPLDFEDSLAALQIPYVMSGGFGLYDRSEIEDLLAFLKLLVYPNDDYSLVKILTGPLYGLKDSDLIKLSLEGKYEKVSLLPRILSIKDEDLPEEAKNFRNLYINIKERANKPGLVNLCHIIIEQAGFYEFSASQNSELKRRRINNNITKFLGIVRDFEQNGVFTSLRDFLNQVDRTRSAEIDEDEAGLGLEEGDAIKIMTIHKSKGLEFPIVIAPFLKGRTYRLTDKIVYDEQYGLIVNEKQTFDKNTGKGPSPANEAYKERDKKESESEDFRKLYVAFTRAENLLVLTGNYSASLPPEGGREIKEPLAHVRDILTANPNLGEIKNITERQELLNKWLEGENAKANVSETKEFTAPKADLTMLDNGIRAIGDFLANRAKSIAAENENPKDIFSLQELDLFASCPRKYFFSTQGLTSFDQRLEKFPTLVGKLAHETIRLFHENLGHELEKEKGAIDLAESLLDRLIPCYTQEKNISTEENGEKLSSEKLKERVMLLLNRYIESDLSRKEPWMFEAEVNVKFDGDGKIKPFFIRGFADRVDRDKSDNIRIIDFKTREYDPEIHEYYKRQLALYRIASARGVLGDSGCLNFSSSYIAYLNPKGLDLREIEPDLENFEVEAAKRVTDIRNEHNWEGKPSEQCETCPYKELCQPN